jgi:hypothetical protein
VVDHLVAGLHCAEVEDLAAPFVLGALEVSEAEAVRAHLAGCPEPHPEFAEMGSVAPALFETVDIVQPSSALRDRILAAAAAETQRERMPAMDTQRDAQRDTQRERMPVVEPAGTLKGFFSGLFRRPIWAPLALAAVVAVAALGAWSFQLRSDLEGLTAYRNGVVAVLDAAAQPDAELALLAAPDDPAGPSGLAAIGGDGSVALVMRDLAPTSGSEVYEAWLIIGSNAPVPIGSFTVGSTRTATFTTNHVPFQGVTVALTREPGPGATTPTLPIIAAGAAS